MKIKSNKTNKDLSDVSVSIGGLRQNFHNIHYDAMRRYLTYVQHLKSTVLSLV